MSGSPAQQPTTTRPVTVYIEGVQQQGNYTTHRNIDWGTVQPGNTYTKNFTVKSNSNQMLLLRMYTEQPEGYTQSWAKNGTILSAGATMGSTLVLTLADFASTGTCTWALFASNSTMITPSPSPTGTPSTSPTPTPAPLVLECTVDAEPGAENITVTNDSGQKITKQATDLPFTFIFTQGDTLMFHANAREGYEFNAWVLSDTTWYDDAELILTNRRANFTITAEFDDVIT